MAYVNLGQVMYPVGAIYQSWSSTSPASLFGGSWSQITEKFLYCANSAGGTGGASTVTLDINQIPKHTHSIHVDTWASAFGGWGLATTNGEADWWAKDDAKGEPVGMTGGGHLTRICHPISDVILGDAQLNLFIGGGLVWHM